ncbi:MAG: 2Fe-2S iron-sulfur cluster-binding protein [Puniceicoccaceae bacterium]
MATVTFISASGEETVVENAGGNLMEIAVDNGVDGIYGDCGGVCSCSTCHVKVRPQWQAKTGQASEIEQDILDLEDEADDRSRLGCQIIMSDELDGLVVDVVEL